MFKRDFKGQFTKKLICHRILNFMSFQIFQDFNIFLN